MAGYIYITNHNRDTHNFGKTRLVKCVKKCDDKVKDGLTYEEGAHYVCQKQTPSSDSWLVFLASRDNMHDGFSFSYDCLMEHFEFID